MNKILDQNSKSLWSESLFLLVSISQAQYLLLLLLLLLIYFGSAFESIVG